LVEQFPFKEWVTSSNLVGLTINFIYQTIMFVKKYFFIKIYFFIISIFALSNILRFYKTHHGFRFADWLINYEAGFVRR